MSELAARYTRWRASPLGRITERLEVALVMELAGRLDGRRVLDLGTGDGTYALEAAARGATVVGVDRDDAMLAMAQSRARDLGANIDFIRASIEALPLGDASIDIAFAITVLCFSADARSALREAARVLVPGGSLVLGELARWSTWAASRRVRGWLGDATWRHVRFRSRRELIDLVESVGLRVTACRGAIHFPRSDVAARGLARIDPLLGRLHAPGAAFVGLAALKPSSGARGLRG